MADADSINFMAKYGRGLVCLALTPERADELGLELMAAKNQSRHQTAFTVSIEAREGVTTGISAADRAHTIAVAINSNHGRTDIVNPGHVFPLIARPGGVLVRAGHTEAAVDLARLAGLNPSGVICEIMNEDGTMARRPQLEAFAQEHDLKFITVAQIVAYRLANERLVRRVAEASLPTEHGEFRVVAFENQIDGLEHVALVKGEIEGEQDILVRMHSECLTGDVFGSMRCDCGQQLDAAMRQIAEEGAGVIVYLKQEGRGIGLHNKLRAYELQDQGHDTVEANERLGFKPDLRDYGIGAQILLDLGLSDIRLLTNNPRKIVGLEGYNLQITDQEPLRVAPGEHNQEYLDAKRDKMGHLL